MATRARRARTLPGNGVNQAAMDRAAHAVFAALADPTRRRVLRLVAERGPTSATLLVRGGTNAWLAFVRLCSMTIRRRLKRLCSRSPANVADGQTLQEFGERRRVRFAAEQPNPATLGHEASPSVGCNGEAACHPERARDRTVRCSDERCAKAIPRRTRNESVIGASSSALVDYRTSTAGSRSTDCSRH